MMKPALFMGLILLSALTFGVYHIENRVESMRSELAAINAQILQDQESVHVLEAEWSLVNQPARLMQLSSAVLALEPVSTQQMVDIRDIPMGGTAPTTETAMVSETLALGQ